MQVRVCPKCGTENKKSSAACSNCYTSLVNIPATESRQGASPAAAGASVSPQPTIQGAPPVSGTAPTIQPGAPQQTQLGYGPPPGGQPNVPPHHGIEMPVKKTTPTGLIVALVLLALAVFGGGGFAFWKFALAPVPRPTEPAAQVVLKFLEGKKTHKMDKVMPYLSKDSLYRIEHTLSGKQAESAGFTRADAQEIMLWNATPNDRELNGAKISAAEIRDKTADPSVAIVYVDVRHESKLDNPEKPKQSGLQFPQQGADGTIQPPAPAEDDKDEKMKEALDNIDLESMNDVECEYVLVPEDGHWKIDLDQTNARARRASNRILLGK